MAEFERTLIQERVRAGMRNARAKRKRLGRPRKFVSAAEIERLCAQGLGWKKIAATLSCGISTVLRVGRQIGPVRTGGSEMAGPKPVANS